LQCLYDFFFLEQGVSLTVRSGKRFAKICFRAFQLFLKSFAITFRKRLCSQEGVFVGVRYLSRIVRD
jgi:hypothetical protein